MIKLIASDLDGTLLKNGAQELPPEVCGLILKLKERHPFCRRERKAASQH